MTTSLLSVTIRNEQDVIAARLRAREIAAVCGFSTLDQARVATTVSELARTLVGHSDRGAVEFAVAATGAAPALHVSIAENMPRNAPTLWVDESLPSITAKLMSGYATAHGADGAKITFWKNLPPNSGFDMARVNAQLRSLAPLQGNVALSEATHQNHELTKALHDLQERQDELTGMAQRLEGADRRKDEFLALLSHELRGPLSTVTMAAQMLRTVTSVERAQEIGAIVARQSGHMSRLVEDLLDVSRVTRGLVTILREPVDVGQFVREAAEQQHAALTAKRQTLALSVPASTRQVNGDRTRLIQVMGNLIGNASRYTPHDGHVAVSVAFGACSVRISVVDNGRGIAPEYLPKLFDLYVQEELSADRINSGLGLGLALVKSLVEVHDGQVHATSGGKGQGSSFFVDLPLLESCTTETN